MKTQSHEQTTDTQLVDRAKAGHWDAFETLTTRYEQAVYSLAVRVLWDARLAEEVTQRTFIAAIKGLKALPRQTGFGAWLLSLASHEILKLARLRPACGKEQADTPSDSGCSRRLWTQLNVSESAISASSDRDVPILNPFHSILEQLNEAQQMVFLLRKVEGLSVRKTAEVLGLSEGSVKARMYRARCRVRNHLDNQCTP